MIKDKIKILLESSIMQTGWVSPDGTFTQLDKDTKESHIMFILYKILKIKDSYSNDIDELQFRVYNLGWVRVSAANISFSQKVKEKAFDKATQILRHNAGIRYGSSGIDLVKNEKGSGEYKSAMNPIELGRTILYFRQKLGF
jgi:hypothetical protein